jgi:small conductance mechanosensitive channel
LPQKPPFYTFSDPITKTDAGMTEYLVHISQLISHKLTGWGNALVSLLPNIVLALILLYVFYRLSLVAQKFLRSFLANLMGNAMIASILATCAFYVINFEGIYFALDTLHLDQTVTQLLAGAGILGLALSFAFQSIATNIISGVIIAAQRPFKIGDLVETNGHMGKVSEIGLRVVTLTTFDGTHVLIPSKEIIENPLKNYDSSSKRRVKITVGVSYGEQLEKVKEVSIRAVAGLPCVATGSEVLLFYHEFADSAIVFDLHFWIQSNDQVQYLTAKSDAIMAIKGAYQAHGITIPFPIRTLDFGIKGGLPLSEFPITTLVGEGK